MKLPRIKIRFNYRIVNIAIAILILVIAGFTLYRVGVKKSAQKKEAQHESTYQIICHNGGRTYYREYVSNGKGGQELREGCR